MARYRIYLRGIDEQIISHGDTDCATDHEACIIAASLIEPGQQAEIWHGARRVHLIGLAMLAEQHRTIN